MHAFHHGASDSGSGPNHISFPTPAQSVFNEFHPYLDHRLTLEERLDSALREHKVSSRLRQSLFADLGMLKAHHLPTYEHSIRVGLLSAAFAESCGYRGKLALLSGLLHDLGKLDIPVALLDRKEWNEECQRVMKKHVIDGFERIRTKSGVVADVVVRSHQFQAHPYPETLPPFAGHGYSNGLISMISIYARLVAIADQYDAAHRNNNYANSATRERSIQGSLLDTHPDLESTVKRFYEEGILSHGYLADASRRSDMTTCGLRLPVLNKTPVQSASEVNRHVAMALSVGWPECACMAPNLGARFADLFLNATEGGSRISSYAMAEFAHMDSKENLRRGPINSAVIELLTPLVVVQAQSCRAGASGGGSLFDRALHYLAKETADFDVTNLLGMRQFDLQAQGLHYHLPDPKSDGESCPHTVLELYQTALQDGVPPLYADLGNEFVMGLPTVSAMYNMLTDSPYASFRQSVRDAMIAGRLLHSSNISPIFLRACLVSAVYLRLSRYPKDAII